MKSHIVIAGGGHAAGQTAISLRQAGHEGPVTLVSEEPYLPYQRPPLSKKFLAGELDLERMLLRQQKYYAEHAIDVRLQTRVEAIDRDRRQVALDDGTTLDYDKLVIATGSHVRRLAVAGNDLPGIHYVRTIDDVLGIRESLAPGARLAIVGGGYIGLEVAAVTVNLGLQVTVMEMAERVMSRVVSPPVSEFFQRVHAEAGVDIRCGVPPASGFRGSGRLEAVEFGDTVLPADLAVIGIGILPTIELAEAAGLECDDGIVVDEFCRTSDPDILAVGDCTRHPNAILARRVRLESVHNAQEQAKTAAATLCDKPAAYREAPWFWSDQYDLKLQIVGLSDGHDEMVIRGDPDARSFAVFYLQDRRLIAVDAINSPREFMLSKKLVAAGARFDAEILADTELAFKDLANAALA